MTHKIRVLFFEPYPMGLGGNFLTQRLILERLDRAKFTPIVLAPIEGAALDEFRKLEVECVVIPPPGNLDSYGGKVLRAGFFGGIKILVDLFRYNASLAKFLRKNKIAVIYNNCVRAQLSIGFAARFTSVPSLLYIKGELGNPLLDLISFFIANKILFFSKQNRDDNYPGLVWFCQKKIDILKIGMDFSLIDDAEERDKEKLLSELHFDPNCVNVIVLAQLYRPKGQHYVIEAMSKLINDFPKIRLYLLGDHVIDEYKDYKVELMELIEQYGLQQYVYFMGWRRDALDVVSVMDIMIHPSLSEGFGRAVLESMALGKPIIASKVGGLREAIKDGHNGFLVEPGNVDEIAQRWRELLLDASLASRLGKAAKNTVRTEYLIDDKVDRLANMWNEMAQGNI